jgi:hypothetical protein
MMPFGGIGEAARTERVRHTSEADAVAYSFFRPLIVMSVERGSLRSG